MLAKRNFVLAVRRGIFGDKPTAYRKLNRQRSVFSSDTALLKALYLATFEATKKLTMSIRNWDRSTANSALCMRDDAQNNRIYMHDEKDVLDVCS